MLAGVMVSAAQGAGGVDRGDRVDRCPGLVRPFAAQDGAIVRARVPGLAEDGTARGTHHEEEPARQSGQSKVGDESGVDPVSYTHLTLPTSDLV